MSDILVLVLVLAVAHAGFLMSIMALAFLWMVIEQRRDKRDSS